MVVRRPGERLGEAQPYESVIGAESDRAGQILGRLRIALGAVLLVGILAQPRDQRRLPFVRRDAVEQLLPIGGSGLGQLLRLVFLGEGRGGDNRKKQKGQSPQHRCPRGA